MIKDSSESVGRRGWNMQKIIDKAVQGDVEAFLELMDRNTLSMYKVARAILKNDHDTADAIQDTILNCFEKIHTLKKHEYFKRWKVPSDFNFLLLGRIYASGNCRVVGTKYKHSEDKTLKSKRTDSHGISGRVESTNFGTTTRGNQGGFRMKKQIIDSQSDHTKLDEHIKKTLNGMFPLPEQVENARNEAYAKNQQQKRRNG